MIHPNFTTRTRAALFAAALLLPAFSSHAQETVRTKPGAGGNLSLKLEVQRAIDSGIKALKAKQDPKTGAWSDTEQPALTALPVAAILGDPSREADTPEPEEVTRGFKFIISNTKSDGGIYGKGLATYNTSLSVMALAQSGKAEYLPIIAKARRLLINQQQDFDQRGEADNLFDGGIGYGGSYAHSDLSNTHLAMEALYYSKKVLADTEFDESGEFDLDWDAAIDFVSLCQNSEKTVAKLGDAVGLREEDKGGFVYFPGDTKAGEVELGDGKVALRSYGSMSYAGLLSLIYAQMSDDDPRLNAVMIWLSKNYTLDENPGLESQGLYYYYHTMAKALSLANVEDLKLADGTTVDWREKLALKLLELQEKDGSWINEGSNRWMENDPVLVTSYAVLALEHIARGL